MVRFATTTLYWSTRRSLHLPGWLFCWSSSSWSFISNKMCQYIFLPMVIRPKSAIWLFCSSYASHLSQNICNIYIQLWSGQNLLPRHLLALQKPGSLTAWEFDRHSFPVRDETEEILDSILPPREWEEDGEKKIIQSRIGTQYCDGLNLWWMPWVWV